MKASHTRFRRAALCIALGTCLTALAPVALAQSATGAVAGRASAGDQIQVVNATTGATSSGGTAAGTTCRSSACTIRLRSLCGPEGNACTGNRQPCSSHHQRHGWR